MSPPLESSAPSGDAGERLMRLERRLRLLLMHLTGPAVRAQVEIDDLVQEVFLRGLAAKTFPAAEPGEVGLWRFLSRLARNTVIDAARAIRAAKRSGRTERLAHSDWSVAGPRASQVPALTPGPATRALVRETQRALEARFASLTREHQRVIGLRQFEALPAREVARRMGRSEAAVHSLYRRALAAWEEGLPISPDSSDESTSPPRSESP